MKSTVRSVIITPPAGQQLAILFQSEIVSSLGLAVFY